MANRLILAVFMLFALFSTGFGQGEDTNKTVVTADRLTYNYKQYTAVFESHVIVVDPRMRIESDELRIIFSKTNSVKSITAIGNVHLKSEDKTATCNRAVYLAETEEVVLTGNARLNRGRDTITGDSIKFFLDEDRVVVEGGTQLMIFPEQNQGLKLPKR